MDAAAEHMDAQASTVHAAPLESIAEDLDAKVELLTKISVLAPTAILATNTSSLSFSELGRRSATVRCLVGTHY